MKFPVDNSEQLENLLSTPSSHLIDQMRNVSGDFLILGAGGKMGPTLARMLRRALDAAGRGCRVIAVSRFSDQLLHRSLRSVGIETIVGDLLDVGFVNSLPDSENVFFLAGMKFGSTGAEATTWATNTYLPAVVADKFQACRIVGLSTGNVYGPVDVKSTAGSVESDSPAPVGEYAMSCLGRERIFEYFSKLNSTQLVIARVNYATELRYGVLVDLALQIFRNEIVSLDTGYFNVIWQPDACEMILSSITHVQCPPFLLNITGPERVSCREVCEKIAGLMKKTARFSGNESTESLLSDSTKAQKLFGPPRISLEEMIFHTVNWILRSGAIWNKPTHFQVSDGKF